MKTIAQLEPLEFLRRANVLRVEGGKLLKDMRFAETVSITPVFTGKETQEERLRMAAEQQKKNLDALMTRMLAEKPESTVEFLKLAVVPDEGETLNGAGVWDALMCMLSDGEFIRFLSSLMKSGLMSQAN